MQISTKGNYGLRAMIHIAVNSKGKPVLLKDIALQEGVSEKYLEAIVSLLKKGGLLKGLRGSHGGYLLTKDPEQITVLRILETLEGSLYPVKKDNGNRTEVQQLWDEYYAVLQAFFSSKKLSDFLTHKDNMYYI